jgi:antitoxin CptB
MARRGRERMSGFDVIARSEATKQSILSLRGKMDCFAALAMTALQRTALQRRVSTLSPENGSDAEMPGETSPAQKVFFASDQLGCEFARRTATDIRQYDRYINPARHHVRAFAVGWELRMTGSTRSSSGLDDRRKRLLFRCWHRGTREMDLILGRFADAEIASLKDDELAQLEHLIEVPDPDLYAALSGDVPLAPEYASSLFDRIKSFRSADHEA